MKKIFLLLLLFTLSCNKDSSDTGGSDSETEGTNPVTNVEALPVTTTPSIPTTPTSPPAPSTTDAWTEEFMDLVNNHRATLGLRALIHDEDMASIARTHSQNMANGSVAFGHTGFSSRCSAARAALGGGNWCGENVAAGQTSPRSVFTSWMNSSGHRANIESGRASHSGFAYARSSSGKYYWTHLFLEL